MCHKLEAVRVDETPPLRSRCAGFHPEWCVVEDLERSVPGNYVLEYWYSTEQNGLLKSILS